MPVKKKTKFDIISIGDAQLDTFVQVEEASVLCNKKKDACWLCLSYADKIPLTGVESAIAGNAANVAIGASRLSLKTAFYTIVGTDEIGDKINEELKKEKVDLKYVKRDKKRPTNYSVVINYQGERTQLVYNEKRDYILPKLDAAKWVYLTALGEGSRELHRHLVDYLRKYDTKLAFNPGPLQLKEKYHLGDILEMTDLLFVNKEEAKALLDVEDHMSIKDLLRDVRHLGPKTVVITEGEKGATLFDGKVYLYMPIVDVPVIEKTGAGDSFATGVVSAIVKEKPFEEALCWGALNSASVIQYIGPQKGLLTVAKMKAMHKAKKHTCAHEI